MTTSWSHAVTSSRANASNWMANHSPFPPAVELGHKLARRVIAADARVLKYGAPIGSMRVNVARGEHVHLHNLKSDYIPSTTREGSDGH